MSSSLPQGPLLPISLILSAPPSPFVSGRSSSGRQEAEELAVRTPQGWWTVLRTPVRVSSVPCRTVLLAPRRAGAHSPTVPSVGQRAGARWFSSCAIVRDLALPRPPACWMPGTGSGQSSHGPASGGL